VGSRYDGGIDLKLRRGDEYVVVQCKHWNAKQVPHNDVHQLLGVMLSESATGAIFVTSGVRKGSGSFIKSPILRLSEAMLTATNGEQGASHEHDQDR